MIQKGTKENQQVFGTYYLQLCQKQNLAPLANIKKRLANKILDFVGDGVKLHEWQLLLKALRTDRTLNGIAIRSRQLRQKVLEDINTEGKAQNLHGVPVLFTKFIVKRIVDTCCRCIIHSEELTSVVFERIPLDKDAVLQIAQAIEQSKSVKELAFPYCRITDEGCQILCNVLYTKDVLSSLDLSGCDITDVGVAYICETLKKQKLLHLEECWKESLRYNTCDMDAMVGLRRLMLNCNPLIGDAGITSLCSVLMDDYWLKALDIQVCGLTESALDAVLKLIMQNETLQIVDIRGNNLHPTIISSIIAMQEEKISSCKIKYQWLKEVPSNNRLVLPASCSNRNPTSRLASSNSTVHTTNTYTTQKPKQADDSRQIQSDTTLYKTKSYKLSSQAKHVKSCDTVPQGNNSNTSLKNKFSHCSQLSCSSTNKKSCPSGNVTHGNNNNASLTNKFSHCAQLSCSKTNMKLCPSDQGASKRTNNGSKIKTRIAVRLGEYGPAPRRTNICCPPAVDAFQKLLMTEA